MHPRPYQFDLIEKCREQYRGGHQRIILQSPTGSGKSLIFCWITKAAVEKGLSVTIIAHRREILDQISATLEKTEVPDGKISVVSVQKLIRELDKRTPPDFVILDECFPAGTPILTPKGCVPIEKIRPGDVVIGYLGGKILFETVIRTFKRPVFELVIVKMGDGRELTCTPNHPFLTCRGWIDAKDLTKFDMVRSITPNEQQLRYLRGSGEKEALRKSQLQMRVVEENNQGDVYEAWRRDNEISQEKRNVGPRNSRQSFHNTTGKRLETHSAGWERETTSNPSAIACLRAWVADRIGGGNLYAEKQRIPNLLQDRHWESGTQGGGGSGRQYTQCPSDSFQGQKEGEFLDWVGVENITILKQTSLGEFGSMCPEGAVYNFETCFSHTYVANGIVVHNCHHAVSESYARIIKRWDKSRFLGVTATPERLDGRGLGEYFTSLVLGPSVAWLIEQGFLARPVYYAPARQLDFAGIRKIAGDYSKSDTAEIVDKPAITGDIVEHYQRLCPGRTGVVFCINLEHAENLAQAFCAAGIPAARIDGKLSDTERKKRVVDLASGALSVLTSCELISEGFDLPAVGAAVLARPTASLSLHLQQIGRALRPAPGKADAIILDHVGNCLSHGLAEEPREWSLEGGSSKRRTKENVLETRQCEKCYAIFWGLKCPQCGTERESKAREIEQREGELERLSMEEMVDRKAKRREEGTAGSLEALIALEKSRGYKRGWAMHRWNARQAKKQPKQEAQLI